MNIRHNTAFTLAEVLITMAVIGVVAALTIPILVQSTNKKELESAFMENYNILHQVSQQLLNENDNNIANIYLNETAMLNAFAQKLKVAKTCTAVQAVGNCWATNVRNLNNTNTSVMTSASPTIVLANGAAIQVDAGGYYQSACTTPWYTGKGNTGVCAPITVDVNGLKKPNLVGRDIFVFYVVNATPIIPDGIPGTDDATHDYCNTAIANTDTNNGVNCGARIIFEGGMKY